MRSDQILNILYCKNEILIINELQNKTYFARFLQAVLPYFLSVSMVVGLFSCSSQENRTYLQTAEDLLWSSPDSCLSFLEDYQNIDLSDYEEHVCRLYLEHATLKVNRGIENDSVLFLLKDYFEQRNDSRYAGETNYIIGRNFVLQQNAPLATFYLKNAEGYLLGSSEFPPQLLGHAYYALGKAMEPDRLFEIANDYYRKALSFFIESKDSLLISCAYRDIVRSGSFDISEACMLLDSAYKYIPKEASCLFYLELDLLKNESVLKTNPQQVLQDHLFLCDSLHELQEAEPLCEYYLENNQLDLAEHYLGLSEQDTANSVWSKEHYLVNKATYLSKIGQKDSAIAVLKALHLWQTAEIENSTYIRSYMVEQRYDAERERAEKQQAQAEKRAAHLYIVVVCVSSALLLSILAFLLYQERLKKKRREEKNRFLESQLLLRQEFLQEQFRLRLNVSTGLLRCIFHHVEDKEAAYKELLSSVLFVNEANWNELLEYFDTAYYGLLTHLRSTYPSLAQIDLLYVVMIVLGISTEDISILTNVTTQSVRNRKQQLKNRVAANLPIEEWLQIEVQACKEQMFAQ